MADSLATLLRTLTRDRWRDEVPFSADLSATSGEIHDAGTDEDRAEALGKWLQRHQPCLFGRIAAQRGLLTYCFLSAADMQEGDDHVRAKIQTARTDWSAEAFAGRRSGFIIALVSRDLDRALPDDIVCRIAKRLTSLYLLIDETNVDRIYLDSLRLEANLPTRPTWEWDVGVNYFSSHGDGRWWHDHRIPVGMALSMNSVGHMVKATIQAQIGQELQQRLDVLDFEQVDSTVDSLGRALKLAMMTIDRAAKTTSGRATWLLPRDRDTPSTCPFELPSSLAGKDFCAYGGFYHTDVTLPSLYFRPDVDRPNDASELLLDLTYLDDNVSDPIDRLRAARGRRIRSEGDAGGDQRYSKRGKALPRQA